MVLVELHRGSVNEIDSALQQLGVFLEVAEVGLGRLAHADVVVGVTQPVHGVSQGVYGALDDFGVELVCYLGGELRLDGQLLVEQREVVLELRVAALKAYPVMMMPSPFVSYLGLPARPIICRMSCGLSSTQRPCSGL